MAPKRAPGGGRKPIGPSPAQPLTIRMQPEMRAQLEEAARRHTTPTRRWTLSQEVLIRLKQSIDREHERERDPAMRALCFLMAELAYLIEGAHLVSVEHKSEHSIYNWRANPFFYHAFKIAVDQLLTVLAPLGAIKAPKVTVTEDDLDSQTKAWAESFKNPEDRAKYSVGYLLQALRGRWTDEDREQQKKTLDDWGLSSLAREFYGMPEAAKALALKPRNPNDTFEITVKTFFHSHLKERKS